ncbi:transient receptor potential cation channel subfamily M member 2 [Poecilia formosa]|uniref:Transient receptor potential cation channel, subfamily M, member 2 n=1 Tax=Poecilia formosa TaxID=48698 RepID=A0A087X2V5_POEFO|nr:PREDICTED: transient receptor potential cation channel subfamily M member 2 [Poecilia formosa]
MKRDEIQSQLDHFLAIKTACQRLPIYPSFQRSPFTLWIKENVSKKECSFFQRDPRCKEQLCHCGYSKSDHTDEAIKPEDFTGETWDKAKHIRKAPTDAFGDISFGGLGQKTSKYVRVSADTEAEVLYELLTQQWKLSPPNLLISVTGGAKNLNLKPQLQKTFRRGLIKVAQTTGAWVITGGTHSGVMMHVGQAVREYALSNTMQGQVVAIGVATWGVIHNRDKLVHEDGCFPANYVIDTQGQGNMACLDNNHTHFLLVDDGTNGHYNVENELRGKLEKYISGKNLGNKVSSMTIPATQTTKIPVVCVAMEGGSGTLDTIYNAMRNDTPCVILEGSGRIADVITQVFGKPVSQITITLIHKLMKKFFGQEYKTFTEQKIIEFTKQIQDIIRMSHLLTIFKASKDDQGGVDLDVAILQALLKASKTIESQRGESWKRQLKLAIAWNRVDLAKTEIFTEQRMWKSSELHEFMTSALVGNKPEFVNLLLENGVCLRDYLKNDDTLCGLYKQLPNCFFLYKLAKRVKLADSSNRRQALGQRVRVPAGVNISLTHVSDEVRHLLGRFTQDIYPPSDMIYQLDMSTEDISSSVSKDQDLLRQNRAEAQRDPGRDLFLWAIIQSNKHLSEIAWDQCRDCISAALAASKILKKMAEESIDADEPQEMLELASHFEDRAIGVFSKCYNSDEVRAQKLLVRISRLWGKTTCLRLALEANDKNFVAQSGVQALLTQIWCGELSVENPVWRVLVCMVFFPLIYTRFVVFRRDELIQRETEKNEEIKTVEKVTGSIMMINVHRSKLNVEPLGCWSRLVGLYCSPRVKFYGNIVSYFAFLFLFAYVLMIDFQRTPSIAELVLYIWLFTLVCEEIRQLFYDPDGFGFRKKAKRYIHEMWNILDVISILLFCLGIAFRLTTQLFYPGKVILCIDFVVFCLRLMAIFTISRILGPKIIIVRKMMRDMFFFMFLLSIWVVAYGVAKQGILIENDNRLDWIMRGAIYEPYLIIFGNFPENIDNAKFDKKSCSMNGTDPLKPKCPKLNKSQMPVFPEWLTIVMLCVYLLFANILLLNLLIAIFNYTFEEVHDNTDKIWKFQRYELIKEYYSRPAAPPPFIIFSHLYLFIRKMVLCKAPTPSTEFKKQLNPIEEEELLSWEALMKDRYLLSARQEKSQSMERCIPDTSQKVTTLTERMEKLEEQVTQSNKSLQRIEDILKSLVAPAKETQPQTSTMPDESSNSLRTAEEEDGFHVKSHQLQFPDSKIKRFPVPEEKVPWEVSFSSYMPTYYSSEDGNGRAEGSGPEDLDNYRNPGGRTGIGGRGTLSRLGPNLNLDLVVTRWRDSARSELEFLAVLNQNQRSLALPGGPVDSLDHLPGNLKGILGKKLFEALDAKVSEGVKVSEGYVDDCRNTDNAWVETTVLNIHLDIASQVMVDINNMVISGDSCLQWQEVSSRIRLSPNQRRSLQQVAELHNTKF